MRVDGGLCGSDGLHAERGTGRLWGRRRLRQKPKAPSRADQHSRRPVGKLSKSLSSFLCHLPFPLSPTHHIPPKYPTCICSPPLTLSLADLWSEPTGMAKCQLAPTFSTKSQQQIVSPPVFGSDTCPIQINRAVVDVLKNSKQPEEISNWCELFKYCTDPSGLPEESWEFC